MNCLLVCLAFASLLLQFTYSLSLSAECTKDFEKRIIFNQNTEMQHSYALSIMIPSNDLKESLDTTRTFNLIKVIKGSKNTSFLIEVTKNRLLQEQLEIDIMMINGEEEINSGFLEPRIPSQKINEETNNYNNDQVRQLKEIEQRMQNKLILIQVHNVNELNSQSLLKEEATFYSQSIYWKTPFNLNRFLVPNCAQINSSTSKCALCIASYYLDNNQNCQICNNSCDSCSNSTSNDCLTCPSGYQLTRLNACLVCGNKKYFDASDNCVNCIANCDSCNLSTPCISCSSGYQLNPALSACIICDTTTNNYIDSSNICQICPTGCATCSSATVCNSCQSSYYLDSSGLCDPCDSSCETCITTSGNCLSCPVSRIHIPTTNTCRACQISLGEYYDPPNSACKACDLSCYSCTAYATCTSCYSSSYLFSDNTCGTCDIMNSYYIDTSNIYCLSCFDSNCSTCTGGSLSDCTLCKSGMTINATSQLCSYCPLNSDPTIFVSDLSNASCTCVNSQEYLASDSSGNLSCLSMSTTNISGYYCDSTTRTCSKCTETECNQCNSSLICLQCNSGYFLIGTVCVNTCPTESSVVTTTNIINSISSVVASCQCNDTQNNMFVYENAQYQCVLKLAISSLKAEVNTNNNMNSVILCLNRAPFADEYAGITIELKTTSGISILSNGSACQQVATTSNGSSQCIARVVSVTLSDKCIILTVETSKIIVVSQINVTSNSYLSAQLNISSLILTTTSYNASHISDTQLSSSLSSISNALAGDNSIALIDLLKSLQLLCLFSNFIQLIAPLVLLFNSLPQVLKTIISLAASFIFKNVPDYNTQIFTESSTTNSDTSSKDASIASSKLLKSLGLESSIYIDYTFIPHLILSISCIIIIFCVSCRFLMKGKQYTIEIFTFLLNFQTSYQQGSLTFTVFSIAYSILSSSNPNYLIVTSFTLLCHIILQILIIFAFHFFPIEQLQTKLPNLLLNLIPSARGSRYYLSITFLKKYLFLIFIITISPHSPFISALLCTILFGLFTIYIAYFRFFSSKILLVFKVFSEFLATFSLCLLTICIKLQTTIITQENEDDISEDSLDELSKLTFAVMIFFSICILLSFLRFFSSTLLELYGMFSTCRLNYKKQKENKKQLELEIYKLEMIPSESNYIQAALEIYFQQKDKEEEEDSHMSHLSQVKNSQAQTNNGEEVRS